MRNRADHSEELARLLRDHMGVRDKDAWLVSLYAREDASPEWATLFSTIDVDREPFAFNYLLARAGAKFGWKNVPDDLAPRLQGVRRKFVAKNAVLLADALKFLRAMNEGGVMPLVVRGGALRLALLPDIPQKMYDVDAVVLRSEYERSCALAVERGFEHDYYVAHSADFRTGGRACVDLHYTVFKANIQGEEPTDAIFAHGTRVERGGAIFLVPCPEDAFLILMVNIVANYLSRELPKGPVTWLADCYDLAQRYELSYADIVSHAREYGVLAEFKVALALMRSYLPNAFPGLYAAAEGCEIDAALLRRVERCVRELAQAGRPDTGFSAFEHLRRVATYTYAKYRGFYCLDGSPLQAAGGYCTYLWRTICASEGIKHVWELPRAVHHHIQTWSKREQE